MDWIGRGAPAVAKFPSLKNAGPHSGTAVNKGAPVDQGLRRTFGLMSVVCGFGANATVWTMSVLTMSGNAWTKRFAAISASARGRLVRIETQINNSLAGAQALESCDRGRLSRA